MDAATKLGLLYQEFGQYADEVGTVYQAPVYTVPGPTLPHLIRRFAELDIEDLYSIYCTERRPNHLLYRLDDLDEDIDRTLILSEAFTYSLSIQRPSVLAQVYFYVIDDDSFESRASILSNKSSIEAVIDPSGHLHVPHITSAQPVMDLIWFHTRLHHIRADDGDTLELSGVPRRFDQLMQATAYIHQILAKRPAASFEVTGELLKYESPLPPEEWLLPGTATP